LIGLPFPQILFFGYETLNELLAKSTLPTIMLLSLLFVKIIATALAAGSGLVGGTFAPALFLGAMTGAAFHNILTGLFEYAHMDLAEVPAYAMVGAACVLAALFRAPLTASLLLFELTRDYDVILPLMASAGIGSVVGDIIEAKVEGAKVRELRRDKDDVSWGDLADKKPKKVSV
jgi:H+/Cl- antiporter ClcA